MMEMFELLPDFVRAVEPSMYSRFKCSARRRLVGRDEDDGPVHRLLLGFEELLDLPAFLVNGSDGFRRQLHVSNGVRAHPILTSASLACWPPTHLP